MTLRLTDEEQAALRRRAEREGISAEYLDLDDLLSLAAVLLGDPPPVRDIGLLGSAASRPQTTAFGADAYPDIWTKAASLLDSVVNNHSLVDGNKRLGWLATATFSSSTAAASQRLATTASTNSS